MLPKSPRSEIFLLFINLCVLRNQYPDCIMKQDSE